MKKTLIAVVLGCAAILAARDIKDNLERAVIGADMIPGWQINKSGKAADYGKGKIIVGHEADEKALQLNAPADRTLSIYMQSSTPVKVGEYLEFSADVKGKGMVTISYYTYNAKDQYIGDDVEKFEINKVGGSTEPYQIDGVAGATISSKAVNNAVNAARDFFAANMK